MARKDFLKKIGTAIMGFGMMCFLPLEEMSAATVTDNLANGGLYVGATAPSNRTLLWMDTNVSPAMPKYWTGVDWAPCNADMLDSHDSSYFASAQDIADTMDVIGTLQTRLTNEITAREEKCETLETGIQNEANDRWEAVNSLSGRIENEVNARVAAITSEASARSTADSNLSNRIGSSVGSATVPVYVNPSGNIAAVNGLDASGFSTFKIPVNPSSTANINLWITT